MNKNKFQNIKRTKKKYHSKHKKHGEHTVHVYWYIPDKYKLNIPILKYA